MLPLVICMCVSTIWGRYHYVADVFAGAITGSLGYIIGKSLMRNSGTVPASDCSSFLQQKVLRTIRNLPSKVAQ
jgi:membrane-associated phospholipid phosphatase